MARLPFDQRIKDRVVEQMGSVDCLGVYAAFNSEVDTYSLIDYWLHEGTRVCVPKCIDRNTMDFFEIKSIRDLKPGMLGILEPDSTAMKIEKTEIKHMYVPMLAFNDEGFRLGYGKGYYDRYLSDFEGVIIGLAYSFQQTDVSFEDEYDVPCHLIVTDQELKVV